MFSRFTRMSLRGRIVVPMVALSVLPATAIAVYTLARMQSSMRADAIEREVFDTALRAGALDEFFRSATTDVRFLSQVQLLNALAAARTAARTAGDADAVATLRRDLERELVLFSQGKRSLYQVRLLDTSGREVMRLNVEEGRARVVPVAELQDKSGRDYVEAGLGLAAGEMYISPMDLNIEGGRVEVPHRPVLRFAMALFGPDGARIGILVLNLDARHLFRLIEPLPPGTRAFLVDRNGVYLGGLGVPEPEQERYDFAAHRALAADFAPAHVETILAAGERGASFETGDDLVSVAPVRLAPDDAARDWRLVVTAPRERLGAPIRRLTIHLSLIIAAVLGVVALAGVWVAETLARPVRELRRAMSDIAANGGVGSPLGPAEPANEIEGVWREFEGMARRLDDARTRLQAVQAGLSRAEKVSSIGQLTRSVTRKIEAPVEALRAAVAAAAGGGRLDAATRDALERQIACLEDALGSFSHLTRSPGAEPEVTAVATVVRSVVTLLESELDRRAMTIDVAVDPGVPPVRGDLDQLRQLFTNLILNAAEAEPRSRRVTVAIAADLADDSAEPRAVGAVIRITDDGRGIPTESLVRIWDPFFTTKAEGLGLGLAICRRIVEEHGGRIEVSSQVGLGTTVTVRLPMAAD